jgi:hypothetical protein
MEKITFRPRNTWFLSGIGITWALLLAYYALGYESGRGKIIGIFIAFAIFCGSYLVFLRPKVELDTDHVIITNPIRRHLIGWGEIIEIEARYTVQFITTNRSYSAWAAPVGGAPRFGSSGIRRTKHRDIHYTELKGSGFEKVGSINSSSSPDTDSGALMIAAQRFLAEYQRNRTY